MHIFVTTIQCIYYLVFTQHSLSSYISPWFIFPTTSFLSDIAFYGTFYYLFFFIAVATTSNIQFGICSRLVDYQLLSATVSKNSFFLTRWTTFPPEYFPFRIPRIWYFFSERFFLATVYFSFQGSSSLQGGFPYIF